MGSPLQRLMSDNSSQLHGVYAGLRVSVAPATEPVTTAEAKIHLRVEISDDDAFISSLVASARLLVEKTINTSLITQTWELVLDGFPNSDCIKLPNGPVQSVTSVKTYDENDTESVFSSSSYLVDTVSDRLALNLDSTWPTDLRPRAGVKVTYVTGYGDDGSDVPQALKQAILEMVAYWYENRGDAGQPVGAVLRSLEASLRPHRTLRV